MQRTLPRTLLLVALLGCDPFGHWPYNNSSDIEESLWDDAVVSASDGVYVRLPRARSLVRVQDSGDVAVVDLDGATPERLIASPSGDEVLVFAKWPECKDDDPDIEMVSDCPEEELSYNAELAVVAGGKRLSYSSIPGHMNAVAFSGDGRTAVAYLDYEQDADLTVDGLVDLTEVVFIPLGGGETSSVSIGFSPNNILFSDDNTKAVIMSRSKVVVVSLETYEVLVEYPLTLDADQVVSPSDAVLTPDGAYALVSIEDSSLLYQLDLENYSIDIEDLDGVPADLAVDDGTDATLIVYDSLAQIDVFDHDTFELLEPVDLDDPATGILLGNGFAVIYNDRGGSHDVYRYDLDTTELTEYVVDNPLDSMMLSDDGTFGVAVLTPEGTSGSGLDAYQDQRWGLAVLELLDDDAVSLVVESQPVGMALVEQEQTTFALVLMDGLDTLLQVDLASPSQAAQIDLPSPPTSIGAMPDGRFIITHEASLGELSFLDPVTGEPTTVGGFASYGLLEEEVLPRRNTSDSDE